MKKKDSLTKKQQSWQTTLNNQIFAMHRETLEAASFEAFDFIAQEPAPVESYLQVNPDGIAVLKISGALSKGMSFFDRIFGGVSDYNVIQSDLMRVLESDISGLILFISSPGGTVDGVKETADLIKAVSEKLPTVAYTDDMMTSAAYWLGSAASKVFAYPTSQIGSIGVVTMHVDFSKADEQAGIKRTYIYNGKYKRLANDGEHSDFRSWYILREHRGGSYRSGFQCGYHRWGRVYRGLFSGL